MRIVLLFLILSSCSIVPSYRVEPQNYCKQKSYNTVCHGYDEDEINYYPRNSIYDN